MKFIQLPDGLTEEIKELVQRLIEKHHRPANEIILDDVDLRKMLKVSRRTLLNYRQSLGLRFHKVENKIFYFLSDIFDFIKSDQHKNSNEQ